MQTTTNYQNTTQNVVVVGNIEKGFRVLDTTNLPSHLPMDLDDTFYQAVVEQYVGPNL